MSDDPTPLLQALIRVPDPAGTGSLTGSGRLAAPRLNGGVASLVVDATGLSAEQRSALERQIRAALAPVEGVTEVRVAMTADKVERMIIAVGSGKGGVGKSTVSANLAIALSRAGKRVGLVDADVYGPSQTQIMGNHDKPGHADKQIVPVAAHGIKMLSLGQMVEPGNALAWRGPMAATA